MDLVIHSKIQRMIQMSNYWSDRLRTQMDILYDKTSQEIQEQLANYYKAQVTSSYGTTAQMYTIAMDMTKTYGITVLNPNTKNVQSCANSGNNTEAKKLLLEILLKFVIKLLFVISSFSYEITEGIKLYP